MRAIMISIRAFLFALVITADVNAAIEPVLIRVAGSEYFIPSVDNNRPVSSPNWVTNYTVPEGKMLVLDAVVFSSSEADTLPLLIYDEVIELDCRLDEYSNITRLGGLRLGPGWQLPGEALVEDSWGDGEMYVRDYKYIIFGYLMDTSTSSAGMLSTIESPKLQGNQLQVTVATPRPAKAIRLEKSRKLQGDWTPVDDAMVQPTADPNRQTVTVPATDPQAFIRATASAPAPE